MSAPTAPRRPVVRRVDQTPIAVALVIALALQASPAQAVPASVAKANAGCQKRFAIGVRKIAATTLKSMARCHAERLRGDVGAGVDCNALAELDAGVIAKIDKLAAKLDGTAEKNCVGKGASLPVTALVDQFYKEVQKIGGGRWDTSSLIKRLRALDG